MNKEYFKEMYENNLIDQNEIYENLINKIQSEDSNEQLHPARNPVISKKRQLPLAWKAILAVCFALVMFAGGFSVSVISIEAKEYRTALTFFQEYDLPTEGLSRDDIKAVYKDITLKIFSYEKTIEILNGFSLEIYSIELGTRDKEELEALWDYRNYLISNLQKQEYGINYKIIQSNEIIVVGGLTKSIINKFDGDRLLWSRTIDYCIRGKGDFLESSAGTVFAATASHRLSQSPFGVVMMFNDIGDVVWADEAAELNSYFTAGVLDGDQFAIFGHRFQGSGSDRQWYYIYKKYNLQGNLVLTNEKKLDEYRSVSTAILVNDYYLVKCFSHSNRNQLMSVSKQGEFISDISYSDNGKEYIIQDIYAYSGKVYLSALLPNIDDATYNEESASLMSEYYSAWHGSDITMPESYNKRLRDLFIERYTAVLLICNDDGGIEVAYSVPNARGGLFSVSEYSLLQWQVIRIDDVKNSPPYISSRRVDITATDFRFMFDKSGQMVKKIEIGITALMA